jgi:hypothetical protein
MLEQNGIRNFESYEKQFGNLLNEGFSYQEVIWLLVDEEK